jgi:hypothetical protein
MAKFLSVCMFFIALLLITFSKTREEIRVPVGVTVGLVGSPHDLVHREFVRTG